MRVTLLPTKASKPTETVENAPNSHLQRLILCVIPLPHEPGKEAGDHVAGDADDAGGAVVVPRLVRLIVVAAPRRDARVCVSL